MKIIEANEAHIDQVVKLFDAYRVWYGKPSDKPAARSFLLERLREKEAIIFVAEDDTGTLVAFTQLYPIFSSVRMKRMWLLNDLFVKPESRGKGISKKLIDRAKDLANSNNACGILLETETSNDIGNQLYPRMGFELESNNFYFWTNQ
jgi:GNAT superfamily N-acetyltransferase